MHILFYGQVVFKKDVQKEKKAYLRFMDIEINIAMLALPFKSRKRDATCIV